MGVATILMLTAAAEPAAAAPVLPRDWTLTPSPPPPALPPSCREEASAGAIVVCGQRLEDVLPGAPANAAEFAPDGPYRMQFGLDGGGTVAPELQQAGMPDGRVSKRILVRVRVPF